MKKKIAVAYLGIQEKIVGKQPKVLMYKSI